MKITRKEFEEYLGLLDPKGIETQDKHGISINRMKANAYYARVGQVLAEAENRIDAQSLMYQQQDNTIAYSDKKAEQEYNEQNEVTKREIKYLVKALDQYGNACASRINVLMGEN